MFRKIVMNLLLISVILIELKENFIECGFATLGDISPKTNKDSCGLRLEPTVHKLYFNNKCFKNSYPNKTLIDSTGSLFTAREDYPESRIYYGHKADYGEAPWAVLLSYHWMNYAPTLELGYCSGTLIALDWVLTSAHCIRYSTLDNYQERMHGIWIRAEFWVNHHAYAAKKDMTYDIALVKLEDSFDQLWVKRGFRAAINPICLPKQSDFLNEREEQGVFFGFGTYGDEKSHFLRKMNLTIMEEDRDIKCYQKSMLCANVTGHVQKACPGDSGGGLIQYLQDYGSKALLIGVLHGGAYPDGWPSDKKKCQYAIVNKYVPVSRYIDWILWTISNLS